MSVDVPLGLPFNIASYGLLLSLIARHVDMVPGTLTGFLHNAHFYRNQEESVHEILERGASGKADNIVLPKLEHREGASSHLFHWTYQDSRLCDYKSLAKMNIPLAV